MITEEQKKAYILNRRKIRYGVNYNLIQKFDHLENEGYVPQYVLNPKSIWEKKTFTVSDYEYIKSMSTFKYPSLEDNKQTGLQKYNMKVKYENL